MVVQMECRFHSSVDFVGPSRFYLSWHKSTICTTTNFKSKSNALTWYFFFVEYNSIIEVKLKVKSITVLVRFRSKHLQRKIS